MFIRKPSKSKAEAAYLRKSTTETTGPEKHCTDEATKQYIEKI